MQIFELPPLYKYLDVRGAQLTLGNRSFKHSKPSEFNDKEDLTIRSIFPESDEVALAEMNKGLTDILLKHLYETPTVENPTQRAKIVLMQQVFQTHPEAAKLVKEQMKSSKVFSLEQMRAKNKQFVNEINEFMQGYRILCVTELNNSEQMWERYAQKHEGIVLRIVPNLKKDSKYQLFRKVEYQDARPPLYESTFSFLESCIFGDQEARRRTILEKIVYAKTREWEYEHEYRLAIPIHADGQDWNTMPYHAEEITELILGHKMPEDTKSEIIGLAKSVNPTIDIFNVLCDDDGKLSFSPTNGP
jgi:hypothetical protein